MNVKKLQQWLLYTIIVLFVIVIIIFLIKIIKKYNITNEYFQSSNDGINNVDKILFINLEARKDRLKSITSELKKQNVTENKIHRINAHYTPGNGHLGCSKSHYDAIQYAIDNDLNNVVVLEDDFMFSTDIENTTTLFNNLFNNTNQNDWDVVLFSYLDEKKEDTKYSFFKRITESRSSTGYIVNKHYFKTLQNIFKESVDNMKQEKTNKIDFEPYALDQLWKNKQKVDNWLAFEPRLGHQDDQSESTIHNITKYK